MRSIIIAIALGGATICTSVPVQAQDGAEPTAGELHARELFERGRRAYERQVYTEAEDAFLAAYEAMSPDNPRRPLILLNVAQAIERQGGRDDDALVAWQRFRTEAASVAEQEHLRRADERIRELEARAERRRAAEPEEAEPAEPPAEPAPATTEPSGEFNPHPVGIAVASLGVAAVVAGALVGAIGLAERGAVLDACDGTMCPADVQDRANGLETYGIAADSLLWPGLGVAAVGAVLMFVLPADQRDEADVTAACGPGGCSVGWRF